MSKKVPPRQRRGVRSGIPSNDEAEISAPRGRGRGRGRMNARSFDVGSSTSANPGVPPPRTEATEHQHKSMTLDSVQQDLSGVSLAAEPETGKSGRPIQIRGNHFPITMQSNLLVHQYDIKISHPFRKIRRNECQQIFWIASRENQACFTDFRTLLYDGNSIAFTLNRIQFHGDAAETHTFHVTTMLDRDDKDVEYSVQWQYVGQAKDMKQVLDLILRQNRSCPYSQNMFRYPFVGGGRSFYRPPVPSEDGNMKSFELGGGRQVWKGHFTSGNIVNNQSSMMNLDVSYTVFLKDIPVIQYLSAIMRQSFGVHDRAQSAGWHAESLPADIRLDTHQRRLLNNKLRGLTIGTNHDAVRSRTYRVCDVRTLPASEEMFTKRNQDGTESHVSVATYFSDNYGTLHYPHLPCIHVGSKKKSIYLPMEVCELQKGQKSNRALTEDQTAKLIKVACTSAPDRERQIMAQFQEACFNDDPFCTAFGLQIQPNLITIEARVLGAPQLQYQYNNAVKNIRPREGVWQLRGEKFYEGSNTETWALLSFINCRKQREIENWCQELSNTCLAHGINMPVWPKYVHWLHRAGEIEDAMTQVVTKDPGCKLVCVCLSAKNKDIYSEVKRVGDKVLGVMTQCVIAKNVFKANPSTTANLALKINAKLEGANTRLVPSQYTKGIVCQEATLLLGVEISHPPPFDDISPSILSVVGNVDMLPFRFGATRRLQDRRSNIIDLADAVRERLVCFRRATGTIPTRIIAYRNGVSDGEYDKVLSHELQGIKTACSSLDPNYSPLVTFICVQRKHHTRLFCSNLRDSVGRAQNVPPGICVDTKIIQSGTSAFYLCSHFGIQGTSRPTKYRYYDEINFSADAIQNLTYELCHIYARCDRAVSIPAPVYYAQLDCQRARYHLSSLLSQSGSDTASVVSSDDTHTQASVADHEMISAISVYQGFEDRMYFV